MNFDFDLLGLYFRYAFSNNLYGLSLGSHSDSSRAENSKLQIDHYSARLSTDSFWDQFNKGYYHRFDAGILWKDFLSSTTSETVRRKGAGATLNRD